MDEGDPANEEVEATNQITLCLPSLEVYYNKAMEISSAAPAASFIAMLP